ncbi:MULTISPECIES: phage tail protein [Nostoc]|uniref:Phage tail protein n=1 Tax=Nostoc paludosum FACHB-159 TaxID=2692908 RepID=A0ABR8K9D8_9NOSO|nr:MULTISPECIES: tail fiber protein [Nostoc]MBD2679859.1 phage tail protein [Nostoc sp. FACHB-857]MBD2736108.1 phage tail protein [Nostoc paludosum FACHB-159]
MTIPYIGEIRMFGGNFAPTGWALCNGQLLAISENDQLFALIGTTYGGDGQTNFALPDLRGRAPIHQGTGTGLSPRIIGQSIGAEAVTLTTDQLPQHNHSLTANTDSNPGVITATDKSPADNVPATGTVEMYARPSDPLVSMSPNAIAPFVGGSQPHYNIQPYLAINFIISLQGLYPSPN